MDEKELKRKREQLKVEIAEELGLMGKVNNGGWKTLTAKESGKIGGLMTKKLREEGLKKTISKE